MLSVNSKLCTFNTNVPPELRSYILSVCPLNHPALPPEFGCHCQGASVEFDPPLEPPIKFAGCIFPRDRAGRILEIKPQEKMKLPKEPKPAKELPGQQKLFQTSETTANDQQSTSIQEPEPMTAATAPAQPVAAAAAPAATPANVAPVATNGAVPMEPLWPRGISIPFIGVTGEFGSGKTLFGLLIDPERCVHFDFEKSAQTYESGLPFKRIDMQDEARAKFTNGRYRPQDLFTLWRDKFTSIPKGRFRVAVIDDVSTLEDGLFEYVRSHPAEFGYTAAQFAKSEPMVWGAGKSYYKSLMLAAGIECCVMVTHMRAQFAGNRPTGKREAKGKETVMELASLYLMLDRKADDKGKVPEKPNAMKLKDRLSIFIQNKETGEFEPHPALPPRITGCTPARIRWYINNPPDYAKLKKDELALPEQLSDDEKLMLNAQMASDQKEAAIAQSANQAAVNEAAKIRLTAIQLAPGAVAQDQSAGVVAAVEQKTAGQAIEHQEHASDPETSNVEAEIPAAPVNVEAVVAAGAALTAGLSLDSTDVPAVPMVTVEQLTQMKALKDQLQITDEIWKAAIAKRGVQKAKELTFQQADEFLANLEKKLQSIPVTNSLDKWANQNAGITPPFDVPATQPA